MNKVRMVAATSRGLSLPFDRLALRATTAGRAVVVKTLFRARILLRAAHMSFVETCRRQWKKCDRANESWLRLKCQTALGLHLL